MADPILIKIIEQNHGILVHKKALISEDRKNYILRDINYFVKIVYLYVFNFVYALAQKLVWISKQNLTSSYFVLRLEAD